MSVSVNRKAFLSALNEMAVVAPKDSTAPILQCVWLRASGGLMRARATDLEVHVERAIDVTGDAEFCAAVDLRRLIPVVKNATGNDITLAADGHALVIQDSGHSMRIEGRDPGDFPSKPDIKMEVGDRVDIRRFYGAVEKVSFAQGKEEYRRYLHGIYLHCIKDGILRVVACDGHRLAYYDLDRAKNGKIAGDGQIFNSLAIKVLFRAAKKESGFAKVVVMPSYVAVVSERLEIFSKAMGHNYPDYERVIPNYSKGDTKLLQIESGKLAGIVKKAASLSNKKDKAVCFKRKNGELVIMGEKEEAGQIIVDVPEEDYEWQGGDLTVAFRARYIEDVASHIGRRMKMVFLDRGSPAFVYDEDDKNFMSLLMPTRF